MDYYTWSNKGVSVDINGKNIFVIDEGSGKDTLVILHGFPSCSYDYWKVLPILSKKFRVIIHDQIGFGLSEKPKEYSYSLFEQADTALDLWKTLNVDRVYLIAHDYGCSVATEILAREKDGMLPLKLHGAVLGNGSMLLNLAKLQLVQKALRNKIIGPIVGRLSTKWVFEKSMKKLWSNSSKIDEEDIEVLWNLLQINRGRHRLSKVSQYLKERVKYKDRWIGALQSHKLPLGFVWAEDDPIAVLDMGKTLHGLSLNSSLITLPGVGHYPMLEAPEEWSKAVRDTIAGFK